MTPNDIRAEIQNLVDLLASAEITLDSNPAVVSSRGGTGSRVTWSPAPPGSLFRAYHPTIHEYFDWLSHRAFSAVLADGALLQISYDFDRGDVVGHRLCFVPSPFDMDRELLFREPVLDVAEAYRDSGHQNVRLRSTIRFDYAPGAAAIDHPASHMTLLWSHCRCAVANPLSIGHFLRFVFRNFYPHLYAVHAFLREWPLRDVGVRCLADVHETEVHVTWRRV